MIQVKDKLSQLFKDDELILTEANKPIAQIKQIEQRAEIPNKLTVEAFSEDVSQMSVFLSIEDLRKDLLS